MPEPFSKGTIAMQVLSGVAGAALFCLAGVLVAQSLETPDQDASSSGQLA